MSARKERIRSEFDEIAELSSSFVDGVGPHEAGLLRHIVRTMAMVAGFCCVIRATIRVQPTS